MTSRSCMRIFVLLALAARHPTLSHGADVSDPPGALWVVMSPAECEGVSGSLFSYARSLHVQLDDAMKRLGRTPRQISTRAALLSALHNDAPRGWLFLFISGHGIGEGGNSRVCVGTGDEPGEWLDINRELLPALPGSLSGAVIVLDSCSSAHVDARLAHIPVALVSASPYEIEMGALFGGTVLSSLAAASDDNCNGVFDDDDLFAGLNHRLQSSMSLTAFEAWPKLRRNAPSPVPLPVRARSSSRCASLWTTANTVPDDAIPRALVEQRGVQTALARGQLRLPRLDRDFFVIADDSTAGNAREVRRAALAAGLVELSGLDATRAAAIAATISFAEIYLLEPAYGWLKMWRLRDGSLTGVVRLAKARCGMPSRTAAVDMELVVPGAKPRYTRADRHLRAVRSTPPGGAAACFEPEGQCFVAPAPRKKAKECEP
jgi:hypothetical protein